MGLTNAQQELIRRIDQGNMPKIKDAALECLKEDKTQKNSRFCEYYKMTLEAKPNFIELPHNISKLAIFEDMKFFNVKRYFISEEEKEIIEHIKRMDKVSKRMKELGISYTNSTLLHGESGTGKSTLAKYISKIIDRPLLYINFSHLIDSYMGSTAKNIAQVFDFARENECVLMLDEIDCISIKRGSGEGSTSGEISRITITLMQELDKLTSKTIVISATNRFDIMDPALVRRFGQIHEVKRLENEDMKKMISNYIEDIGIDVKAKVDNNIKKQSEAIKHINDLIAKEIESDIITNAELSG